MKMDRISLLLLIASAMTNALGSTVMKHAYGGDTSILSSGIIAGVFKILLNPWIIVGLRDVRRLILLHGRGPVQDRSYAGLSDDVGACVYHPDLRGIFHFQGKDHSSENNGHRHDPSWDNDAYDEKLRGHFDMKICFVGPAMLDSLRTCFAEKETTSAA